MFKANHEYGFEYLIEDGMTVDRVEFRRYNEAAGIDEIVSIHWTKVFKWADADKCGGLRLCGIVFTNGQRRVASGRFFTRGDNGTLAEVWSCNKTWMRRLPRSLSAPDIEFERKLIKLTKEVDALDEIRATQTVENAELLAVMDDVYEVSWPGDYSAKAQALVERLKSMMN